MKWLVSFFKYVLLGIALVIILLASFLKYVLLGIALVIILLVDYYQISQLPYFVEIAEKKSLKNLETGIVRVDVKGEHFNIPLGYMYGEVFPTGMRYWPTPSKDRKKLGAVHVMPLLPDMRPYYLEDDARWKALGHGDRVNVSITKPVWGGSGWYGRSFKRIQKEVGDGLYQVKKLENIYGLIQFEDPGFRKFYPLDGHELTISCYREKVPFPGCSVKSNYRDGLVLEYFYARKFLPQWQEIDDGLKTLCDTFAQAAATEQTSINPTL